MKPDASLRRPPDVATPKVLATTTGLFYVAGGLAVLLGALDAPGDSGWLFGIAAVASATGAALLRWGRLLPQSFMHVLVASGTVLVSGGVLLAPSAWTALAVAGIFTFVAVDVFYYFSRRPALAQLALLLVAAAGSLLRWGTPPGAVGAFLVVLVAVAVVAGDLAQRAGRASRDPLTGLLNRRGFDDALDTAVLTSVRAGAPLCAALVDVDHFKSVNDTHGHQGGDVLLRTIATDLRRHLPPVAVIGRFGGDEFAVLLPMTDEDDALACLDAARRASRHPLSVGVVGHLAAETGGELLRRADAALYQAKEGGRDRTVLGDATTSHLSRDLAAALLSPDDGGLHVVLQPVVEVGSGRVVGVEALARWDHPTRGPVPPVEFVSIAESAGLIGQLGALVAARACAEAQPLRERWGTGLLLTINASGRELVETDYADGLLRVLEQTGWPASQLVVEVTESVLEAGSAPAVASLTRLQSSGVRVAIDDFGAGYSAFHRLDEVPADFLKIDKSLLDSATTSPRRRAMLEAVLGISASLGLTAIAEGVETSEQAELLLALGCPLAQGYHFARPARSADLLGGSPQLGAAVSSATPSPSATSSAASSSSSSSSSQPDVGRGQPPPRGALRWRAPRPGRRGPRPWRGRPPCAPRSPAARRPRTPASASGASRCGGPPPSAARPSRWRGQRRCSPGPRRRRTRCRRPWRAGGRR